MKKTILCIALAFSSYASAQVGINTDSPQATLDIAANQDGTIAVPSGLLIPRITRMQAAKVTTSLPLITTPVESTLIYINDISGETYTNGVAMDIDTKGYYFYSAVNQKWTKIANNPDGTSNFNFNFENGLTHTSTGNITNVQLGGELKKPTTITTTTGDNNTINNLAIIGDVKNAFSVDGTTFSVDGATNNVGIGTTSPKNKLHVTSGNLQLEGLLRVGSDNNGLGNPGTLGQVLVSKGTDAPPEWTNIVPPDGGVLNPIIINAINGIDSNDDDNDGIYKVMLGGNPIVQETVLRVIDNSNASLKITGENINDFSVGGDNLSVDNKNDRVGIGTTSPDTKLHINNGINAGAIKIQDGTQANGKVLTSDANGVGTWKDLPTATPLTAANGIGLDVDTNTLTLGGDLTKNGNTVIKATPNSKLNIAGDEINAFSVESTTTTNLSVDNKNNRVGIGTTSPDTKLHIEGGKIKIKDGTEGVDKVLVSDNQGVGSWTTLASVKEIVTGKRNISSNIGSTGSTNSPVYSGYSITLSKGRWVVDVGFTFLSKLTRANRVWQLMYLSSSDSVRERTGFSFLGEAKQNTSYAGVLHTVEGLLNATTTSNDKMGFINGSNIINVERDEITLYILIENKDVDVWEFRTGAYENYFYATPIN